MKKIGIVVATTNEFTSLFNFKYKPKKVYDFPYVTYFYKIKNKKIYVSLSGIGETAAAACTQYLISEFDVEFIFNYGACGSLNHSLALSDIVFIDKIVDLSFDTSPIDNCAPHAHIELNFKDPVIDVSSSIANQIYSDFPSILKVTCASNNIFVADATVKESIYKEYNASICEMESIGIYLTCLKNNIGCFFIKAVSDTVQGGPDEYYKFCNEVALKAFNILETILTK